MQKAPIGPNLKYSWQRVVFDALIERHPEHIDKKLTAAERTIAERLVQRNLGREEALALLDSLSALKWCIPRPDHERLTS